MGRIWREGVDHMLQTGRACPMQVVVPWLWVAHRSLMDVVIYGRMVTWV